MTVKDSNGTELNSGDNVSVIKDLKVKGSSIVIKRGTLYKGIRLIEGNEEVQVGSGKNTLYLRACFLKKV